MAPTFQSIGEPPITGLISSPVYLGRYLINSASRLTGYLRDNHPTTLGAVFLPTLKGYKNKQTFKSAYELILAGEVGMVFGGCKSAYDRAGEVKINQSAMINEFTINGKLPDFFDSDRAYYDYLNEVSRQERTGHQYRVVAANDRIGARKLWEILTHYYTQVLSQNERDISKGSCAKFRKISSPPTHDTVGSFLQSDTMASILKDIPPSTRSRIVDDPALHKQSMVMFERIYSSSKKDKKFRADPASKTHSSKPSSMR